jgi:hypothetical protein
VVPRQDGLVDNQTQARTMAAAVTEAPMSGRSDPKPRRPALAAVVLATITVLTFVLGGPVVSEARAATTVNLDQWATIAPAWQNGNLNGNNTRYPEGGIVPFRLAIEGLKAGSHTIRIQYDFTAGGHKAYDFLARYSGWVSPTSCGSGGGGVSSMCPSLPGATSKAFPSDSFSTDKLSVSEAEVYSGVSRQLTIWGGSIGSISGPTHAGSTAGNSTAEFVVQFSSSGPSVLLAWGGHLAQSAFWNLAAGGTRDGAGEVSGAPWHMRTLQLDGSGNKNQDRSIQPSAIVGELGPRALAAPAPTPKPTPVPRAAATPRPPAGATPRPPTAGSVPTDPPIPTAPPTSIESESTPADTGTPIPVAVMLLFGLLLSIVSLRWRFPVRSRLAGRDACRSEADIG